MRAAGSARRLLVAHASEFFGLLVDPQPIDSATATTAAGHKNRMPRSPTRLTRKYHVTRDCVNEQHGEDAGTSSPPQKSDRNSTIVISGEDR